MHDSEDGTDDEHHELQKLSKSVNADGEEEVQNIVLMKGLVKFREEAIAPSRALRQRTKGLRSRADCMGVSGRKWRARRRKVNPKP